MRHSPPPQTIAQSCTRLTQELLAWTPERLAAATPHNLPGQYSRISIPRRAQIIALVRGSAALSPAEAMAKVVEGVK